MTILAYGINHKTADISLRERIAFSASEIQSALTRLIDSEKKIKEAAILSTCNRTEVYCATTQSHENTVKNWLASDRQIKQYELDQASYTLWEKDAASHIMRVASGLDSQIVGEPQIMGQVKTAYELARAAGTLGTELNVLSDLSLRVAKRVRTETEIGNHPVSVAYAAVTMAQQIFTDIKKTRVLLIGAGKTIDLVSAHMQSAGVTSIDIANRTISNAARIAVRTGGSALKLSQINEKLHRYDVVISSTGSTLPILGKGAVEKACRQRRHKPIFMVDIAVPRDIEPEVQTLSDVYLYSIDDLTEIIDENIANRTKAAEKAEQLIHEGTLNYEQELRVRSSQDLVSRLREGAGNQRDTEVAKALLRIKSGSDPEQVIERLGRDLTNKLIHPPTIAMRTASADNKRALLEYLISVYDLD
ncbi:MAG: glutamyl-tRNA reductase [Pseudomonadales bacterium]|nr:glutamyl-tRNA reductase [Pseudomonadales bacterium]